MSSTAAVVKESVHFLLGEYPEPKIMECVMKNSEGHFRRTGSEYLIPYSPLQMDVMEAIKNNITLEVKKCVERKECITFQDPQSFKIARAMTN